jgi:hypothetical protein
MKEFVLSWEQGFYDKETKTWKAETRNKFATKTRLMIDGMFVKEDEIKEEPKKGKGKGEPGKGNYVDAESLVHKAAKSSTNGQKQGAPAKAKPATRRDDEPVAVIPVHYPEPKLQGSPASTDPGREAKPVPEAIRKFLPVIPPVMQSNTIPGLPPLPPLPPTPAVPDVALVQVPKQSPLAEMPAANDANGEKANEDPKANTTNPEDEKKDNQ